MAAASSSETFTSLGGVQIEMEEGHARVWLDQPFDVSTIIEEVRKLAEHKKLPRPFLHVLPFHTKTRRDCLNQVVGRVRLQDDTTNGGRFEYGITDSIQVPWSDKRQRIKNTQYMYVDAIGPQCKSLKNSELCWWFLNKLVQIVGEQFVISAPNPHLLTKKRNFWATNPVITLHPCHQWQFKQEEDVPVAGRPHNPRVIRASPDPLPVAGRRGRVIYGSPDPLPATSRKKKGKKAPAQEKKKKRKVQAAVEETRKSKKKKTKKTESSGPEKLSEINPQRFLYEPPDGEKKIASGTGAVASSLILPASGAQMKPEEAAAEEQAAAEVGASSLPVSGAARDAGEPGQAGEAMFKPHAPPQAPRLSLYFLNKERQFKSPEREESKPARDSSASAGEPSPIHRRINKQSYSKSPEQEATFHAVQTPGLGSQRMANTGLASQWEDKIWLLKMKKERAREQEITLSGAAEEEADYGVDSQIGDFDEDVPDDLSSHVESAPRLVKLAAIGLGTIASVPPLDLLEAAAQPARECLLTVKALLGNLQLQPSTRIRGVFQDHNECDMDDGISLEPRWNLLRAWIWLLLHREKLLDEHNKGG